MLIGIFSTIKINKDQMLKAVNESFILALDLAELLVNEYNIPFRQSHKIVAKLVRESKNPQDILKKKNIEKAILDIENKKITLSEKFVESLIDLNTCLDKRISQGSPSEKEVKKFIQSLNKDKNELNQKYLKRVENVEKAKSFRENLIKKLKT